MGRLPEALHLIEQALSILRATLGDAHPTTETVTKNRDQIAAKPAARD